MHPLKQWRTNQGLSQADLAEKIGCGRPLLSLIESDNPHIRRIPSLALAVKIEKITQGQVTAVEMLADRVPPDVSINIPQPTEALP